VDLQAHAHKAGLYRKEMKDFIHQAGFEGCDISEKDVEMQI
jgi:hypothetical protein